MAVELCVPWSRGMMSKWSFPYSTLNKRCPRLAVPSLLWLRHMVQTVLPQLKLKYLLLQTQMWNIWWNTHTLTLYFLRYQVWLRHEFAPLVEQIFSLAWPWSGICRCTIPESDHTNVKHVTLFSTIWWKWVITSLLFTGSREFYVSFAITNILPAHAWGSTY